MLGLLQSSQLNKNVFFSSVFFIALITLMGSIFPKVLGDFFNHLQAWLVTNTGWFYVLFVGTVLFVCIWLMLSRLSTIKLGPDHAEPEFTYLSWFAMLFSAGMGIGLMFWGVAEPMMHFSSPPVGEGQTIAAAKEALKITFFHWGLHAWAIYALLALILGYFCYRKGLPLLPRSAFYPLLGKRIYGKLGDAVDTFAVIGTMFGVAASLGLGVAQVNAGLSYLTGMPQETWVQIVLIAIITSFATISVVLGLDGGIRKLSNINVILAIILMGSILLLGNTVSLMQSFIENTGAYLSDIVFKTFNLYAYEKKESWIGGWTLLYWAWWIAWCPFVGMFIARISRGRTIREFLVGVLFVPTGFTFLWMTVFGNSGIDLVLNSGASELAEAVGANVPVALFKFFEYFPFSSILSVLGVLLVVTFFVSSSDSGSLVIDTLTSGGAAEPPVWQRIFWAVTEGVVAAVLLLAGGLEALQTMTIVAAFPLVLIMILALWSFIKSLRSDYALMTSVQHHNTTVQYSQASVSWKDRLEALVAHPEKKIAGEFLKDTVVPALKELKDEMLKRGLKAELLGGEVDHVALVVKNKGGIEDFRYQVQIRSFSLPSYGPKKSEDYYRAEVFLLSGGQDYDIYGYSHEQVLADALTQFEKHFHYVHLSHAELVD